MALSALVYLYSFGLCLLSEHLCRCVLGQWVSTVMLSLGKHFVEFESVSADLVKLLTVLGLYV